MTPEPTTQRVAKPPQLIFDSIFAFPPNRDTMGGTAYLIRDQDAQGQPCNLLIDVPAWRPEVQTFLEQQGGVAWLFITQRGGLGQAATLQKTLHCQILMQEQEAYLLPEADITAFGDRFQLTPQSTALWTPGHSPGSACLYHGTQGGILFTGRHLLPDGTGQLTPLRFSKTFHWPRQLHQVRQLQTQFDRGSLAYICPGANVGFLRGRRYISDAWDILQAIDCEALRQAKPRLL